MAECMAPACENEVDLEGTTCTSSCYSEWLSLRLYEATEHYDPFAAYQVAVPVKLAPEDPTPKALIMQPWYWELTNGQP